MTTAAGQECSCSREAAIAAVNEYGAAWVAQDAERIAALFTTDASYVERPFDEAGTFCGKEAIQQYWTRQVGAHQTNIRFRQLDRELLWDAERHTALAKWEAAFDKRRGDGTTRPCHFVQVAVLRFALSGKIEFLEEYWHSTTKQRRHDDAPAFPESAAAHGEHNSRAALVPPAERAGAAAGTATRSQSACTACGSTFATRNQLFAHLRGASGVLGTCTAVQPQLAGTRSKKRERFAFVVAYTAAAAADMRSTVAKAWVAFTGDPCVDPALVFSSAADTFLTTEVGAIGDVLSLSVSHDVATKVMKWARPETSGRDGGLRQEAIVLVNQKLRAALAEIGYTGDSCDSIQCVNIIGPCSRDFDAKKNCERRCVSICVLRLCHACAALQMATEQRTKSVSSLTYWLRWTMCAGAGSTCCQWSQCYPTGHSCRKRARCYRCN